MNNSVCLAAYGRLTSMGVCALAALAALSRGHMRAEQELRRPYAVLLQVDTNWELEQGFREHADGTIDGFAELTYLCDQIDGENAIGINWDTRRVFGDFSTNKCHVYVMRMDYPGWRWGPQVGRCFRITPVHTIHLEYDHTIVDSVSLQRCAPNSDDDDDGVPFIEEYQHATNPFSADSDGDGADDFIEIYGTTITLLLPTGPVTVNTLGTDPWLRDSDGDGVLDGVEIHGLVPYGFVTDPNNPDTDGDGVIDGLDPNPLGAMDANDDGIADEWVSFWTNQVARCSACVEEICCWHQRI